jgi:hypothetical protein
VILTFSLGILKEISVYNVELISLGKIEISRKNEVPKLALIHSFPIPLHILLSILNSTL